ncbi:outer membrane beta-barrel protein [Escherichia coli O128:H42]|uniref:outer membrane beta-barrel protein n=1 Tax=Escherichia coli TaxID=562 RepID=UPI000B7E761C|nr:outer membrane beta-barrel protein [Escherichia coli]EFA4187432.1 outer membrane beta-barrel protein [Escherichia coli O128:H42]EFA4218795.1 outer membrane beta-barrel protein [Escherichia coli O19:H42]EEY3523467.1 capsular biosynthesis protein [Escherichia coli]EFC5376245.1 outer membrane beta-barrel protein [Escherichia coli]EFN8327743.1 capsular biosynthesis protein [Escherichia coli]
MRTEILVIAGIVMCEPAWADLTPKSHIGIAGIDFQANAATSSGYVKNITYQPYARDAKDSLFNSITPTLVMSGERCQDKYLLMYSGDYRHYDKHPADNYNDHSLHFNGAWRYGGRHGLMLKLEDSLGHEERGQGITEGFLPEQYKQFGVTSPLKTHFLNSELRYSFGAPKGRGKAEVALLYKKLRFGNTGKTRNADVDFYHYIRDQEWYESSLVTEIIDQYTSRTRFHYTFMVNQRRYNYIDEKDTNEYYLHYGVKSKLSGKTTANMNIGWLYKSFKNSVQSQDFNGISWNIQGEWKSLKKSTIALHTSQSVKDPSEIGGYILVTKYSASYQYLGLNDQFLTTLDYSFSRDDYKNQVKRRRDKNGMFSVSMSYEYTPSVNFDITYIVNTLNSNKKADSFYISPNNEREVIRTLGYDNSMIMLTAKVQI